MPGSSADEQLVRAPGGPGDDDLGALGHLDPHITERNAGHGAGHATDVLPLPADLVARRSRLDLEHAQSPVDVPAVAKPCDRFLAGVAALREADVRVGQARLCG